MIDAKNVHFMSETVEHTTPKWLAKWLKSKYHYTLDPASTHENAICKHHYTIAEDGLQMDWGNHSTFVNPPYGKDVSKWVQKSFESSLAGAFVTCLLPSRSDTAWFHDWVCRGEIFFLRGRLKFGDAKNVAPFPSLLVNFNRPTPPKYFFPAHSIDLRQFK